MITKEDRVVGSDSSGTGWGFVSVVTVGFFEKLVGGWSAEERRELAMEFLGEQCFRTIRTSSAK